MTRTSFFLQTVLMVAVPAGMHAQVNIERFRREAPRPGWSASSTIDLSVLTGNVDLVLIGLGTRVDHVIPLRRTMLIVNGDIGWESGERFSNRGLLHLRRLLGAGGRPQPEIFAQSDYDRSRDLSFRALIGAGPRLELVRRRSVRVSAGTAYMLEHERLDLSPSATHPRHTTHHRWSSYLAASVGSDGPLNAAVTVYAQPRIDELEDLRLLLDGSLAARAARRASLTLTVNLRYDSRPPDDVRPLDLILKSGISIEW